MINITFWVGFLLSVLLLSFTIPIAWVAYLVLCEYKRGGKND